MHPDENAARQEARPTPGIRRMACRKRSPARPSTHQENTMHADALQGRACATRRPVASWFMATACCASLCTAAVAASPNVPPPPCHPNPHGKADRERVEERGDVRFLPDALQDRLQDLAERPHSVLPIQAFAEADKP